MKKKWHHSFAQSHWRLKKVKKTLTPPNYNNQRRSTRGSSSSTPKPGCVRLPVDLGAHLAPPCNICPATNPPHIPCSRTLSCRKECAPFLTPSVSYIFNLSVTTGVFPAVWKQATVIPLYKNRGTAEDPSNYRLVSLLPALGKALDKIQSQRLLKHLVDQQLISPHQFGFIPGKSTTMVYGYTSPKNGIGH